jgi:hypothetical protein
VKEGVGATLAVVILAGLGVAVVQAAGPGPANISGSAAGVPRYYVQESFGGTQPVVRATATGAVTATIRCPWQHAQVANSEIAATANQAFFVVCKKATRHGQKFITTGSRIYLFQLTGSGRISGYSLVQAGCSARAPSKPSPPHQTAPG